MKAIWNQKIIAEAPKEDLIRIEGNWYFPPESIKKAFYTPTDTHTTCFWKGEAHYYCIKVDRQVNKDAAWYYPEPMTGSIDRVGKNFAHYVAFWRGIEVVE